MASQTLRTIVSIGGNVDNTFGQIGAALTGLGSEIDKISQKIINFGKESLDTYREYEDGILETRSVWQDSYNSTAELDKVMAQLESHAQSWAANSIFHTDDVSNALAVAAHAGWDYADMLEGIPAAMLLAQAGDMELAESVDYIAKILKSTGTEFDDSIDLLDAWAKSANLVATDIPEIGDALMKLGATAQLADSTDEIFTLLAVLANVGTTGTEAGTALRNTMMRLVAPTKKAAEAMQGLGFTDAELEEAFEGVDEKSEAAYARLQEFGFSAYDEKGNLKGFIELFSDLSFALDQLPTEQEQNEVLASIFPTRTFSYAKAMLEAARTGDLAKFYAEISGVDEGYMEGIADTMMSGLTGATELFNSKVEELKRKLGEELAPQVEDVYGGIGEIVDSINNMDDDTFSVLVKGVEAIAAAGPALLMAGGAFRIIGYLLTPAGGIGLGLTALAAGAAALKELSEIDMANNFGDMSLDTQTLSDYVVGLGEDFKAAYADVNEFNTALEQSVTDYEAASSAFSSKLMTTMLTGATLTDDDKETLNGLGTDMYEALMGGIANGTAASMSYFQMLFGGDGTAEYDPDYQNIINLTNQSYVDALETAKQLSQGLRDALTSAFDDGTVSQEEYAEIQSWMQSYNDAMAEAAAQAQAEEDYINQQMLFHKAQTASYDQIKAIANEVVTERDSLLSGAEEEYLRQRFGLEYRYDNAIANGTMIDGKYVTEADKESALSALDDKYNTHITAQSARYDDILRRLWQTSIEQSDLGSAYGELGALADRVLAGELTAQNAVSIFKDMYGNNVYAGEADLGANNTRTQIGEYLARMIASYGGYEGLTDKADYYERMGDEESAAWLRKLYAMQQINDNFAETGVVNYDGIVSALFGDSAIFSSSNDEYGLMQAGKSAFDEYMRQYIAEFTADTARSVVSAFSGENGGMDAYLAAVGNGNNGHDVISAWDNMSKRARSEYTRMLESMSTIYDFDKVIADMPGNMFANEGSAFRDDAAVWSLLYGDASKNLEKYRIQAEVEPIVEDGAVQEAAGDTQITAEVVPEAAENLTTGGTVTGLAESAEAELAAAQDAVSEGITADARVAGLRDSTVAERNSAQSYLNSNPGVWKIRATYTSLSTPSLPRFAEGGRATEPSIFGEVPGMAEWAIPEEHTPNTAMLLSQAASASGFTWQEIAEAAETGASKGGGNTLVYSPTIVANDATGVEQKLQEDKERLEKWFRSKRLRDDIAVYA